MVLGVAAMRLRRLHDVQIHVEGHLRNRSSPSVTIALHRGQFDHGSEVPGSGALLGQDSGRSHWPIVLARGLLEWRATQQQRPVTIDEKSKSALIKAARALLSELKRSSTMLKRSPVFEPPASSAKAIFDTSVSTFFSDEINSL